MRLLQWFYQAQFEAVERISSEDIALGVTESLHVLDISSGLTVSDPLHLGVETSVAFPPIVIESSDTFSVTADDSSDLLPIDGPLGTGQIPVGVEEDSLPLVQPCALSLVAVGIVEGPTAILFVGELISIAGAESVGIGFTNEEGVIFPFIQVDDADASESFSIGIGEASTLVITVLSQDKDVSESLSIGVEESGQAFVSDIPSSDIVVVGLIEAGDVFAAEVFAKSLENNTPIQLIEGSSLVITTLSQDRDVSESLPLGLDSVAILPLVVSVGSSDTFTTNIDEVVTTFPLLVSQESLAVGTIVNTDLVVLLTVQETWSVQLGISTDMRISSSVVEAVALSLAESTAVQLSVAVDDAMLLALQESPRIDSSFGAVDAWQAVLDSNTAVRVSTTGVEVAPLGVSIDPAGVFPLLIGVDPLPLGTGESLNDLTFIIAPDPPTVEIFPGLQATWDDDPYMSLK